MPPVAAEHRSYVAGEDVAHAGGEDTSALRTILLSAEVVRVLLQARVDWQQEV